MIPMKYRRGKMECTHFENKTLHRHSTFLLWREKKICGKHIIVFTLKKKKIQIKAFFTAEKWARTSKKITLYIGILRHAVNNSVGYHSEEKLYQNSCVANK